MLHGQDIDGILKSGILYHNVRATRSYSAFFRDSEKIGNSPLN
jgi:hypothetical protein